jgi:D-serine dehydratase
MEIHMKTILPADPAREDVLAGRPTLWLNPAYRKQAIDTSDLPVSPADVHRARLN